MPFDKKYKLRLNGPTSGKHVEKTCGRVDVKTLGLHSLNGFHLFKIFAIVIVEDVNVLPNIKLSDFCASSPLLFVLCGPLSLRVKIFETEKGEAN